jgi:hypothetical protein
MGVGLHGRRHSPAPLCCSQVLARRCGTRSGRAGAVSARGPGCFRTQSSQHLHHSRHRGSQWMTFIAMEFPEDPHRKPAAGPGSPASPGHRDFRRARRRARQRHRPPRHQAQQHLRDLARTRQDSRLRRGDSGASWRTVSREMGVSVRTARRLAEGCGNNPSEWYHTNEDHVVLRNDLKKNGTPPS